MSAQRKESARMVRVGVDVVVVVPKCRGTSDDARYKAQFAPSRMYMKWSGWIRSCGTSRLEQARLGKGRKDHVSTHCHWLMTSSLLLTLFFSLCSREGRG